MTVSRDIQDFMDKNLKNLELMDSLYWVVGKRGSGKSQVLEILARKCIENYRIWGIIPIVASVSGLDAEAKPKEVLKETCKSISRSLVYYNKNFKRASEYMLDFPEGETKVRWDVGKIFEYLASFEDKFSEEKFSKPKKLEGLLEKIRKEGVSYLLLIDEIDKIKPMSFYSFLIKNQPFFMDLIDLKAKMIVSMSSEVFSIIKDKEQEEANYFKSVPLYPPTIHTFQVCKQLVDSRIRMKKKEWESPFDEPSYQVLLKECGGIPRNILREAGHVIEAAHDKKLNTIPAEFVREYFDRETYESGFKEFVMGSVSSLNQLSRKINALSVETVYPRIIHSFRMTYSPT